MTTRSRTHTQRTSSKRWSKDVTENSHAMDLEPGVFTKKSPRGIAGSLKRSAERSYTRKSDPFRSAMSMLTFYVNRAGDKLSSSDADKLQKAKDELRKLFKKPPSETTTRSAERKAPH